MFEKNISIFTGHFGSGKTELAVNAAMDLKKEHINTAIVDLDIVNPFFRTTDVKEVLEANGIRVIAPNFANTNVDVPSLSPMVYSVFGNSDLWSILDVGGDDIGAKVLASLHQNLKSEDYEMFFVINIKRPFTRDKKEILDMIEQIEYASRLKITKLVNNTNLLEMTSFDDLLEGQRIVSNISQEIGIPIAYVSGVIHLQPEEEQQLGVPYVKLNKYIHLPWTKQEGSLK